MASESIPLCELLQCLVECSQKAARIAQLFRDENDLFQLLVEEKSTIEKNQRFVQDFKTLADVLVQETIKRDVGEQFPSLISNIRGEEQNKFQNSLGESIVVELTASEDDTVALLNKVLDGRDHIARSIASVVHSSEKSCEEQYSSSSLIPVDKVGIWIDPIDSTAEYIQAINEEKESFGIQQCGLQCVCVLIGAYEVDSGNPILGVVNQPFFKRKPDDSKWESRFYWSISHGPDRATSTTLQNVSSQQEKIAVLSLFESRELQDIIASNYKIVHTAGAGHKALLVACGKADLYVLAMGTTYFWDICGPHALLLAQGGGIVRFDEVVGDSGIRTSEDLLGKQVKYLSGSESAGNESFRNTGGFIAYRNPADVIELLDLLSQKGYLSNK